MLAKQLAPLVCHLIGLAFVVAMASAEASPNLLQQLDQELANLDESHELTIKEHYPGWQATAERLIQQSATTSRDGLALKQMANLFAKIEQTKYAAQRFGLRLAKQVLQTAELAGTTEAELLIKRAKLRSLVDAYHYGDKQWPELYLLIEQFVQPAAEEDESPLYLLAREAHAARFAAQKLATEAHLEQEQQLAQEAANKEQLLAHLDGLLDEAAKCEQCRQLAAHKDETNFHTYPLAGEQQVAAGLPLEGPAREAGYLATGPAGREQLLAGVDEEDIGLQGMELLGLDFD